MFFGRKKKSASKQATAHDEVDGVIRRGLAEMSGDQPSERAASRPRTRGANPYESTGRAAKRSTAVPKPRSSATESPYEGPNNPYDNAGGAPAKPKRKSWDDAYIGVSKGR